MKTDELLFQPGDLLEYNIENGHYGSLHIFLKVSDYAKPNNHVFIDTYNISKGQYWYTENQLKFKRVVDKDKEKKI